MKYYKVNNKYYTERVVKEFFRPEDLKELLALGWITVVEVDYWKETNLDNTIFGDSNAELGFVD